MNKSDAESLTCIRIRVNELMWHLCDPKGDVGLQLCLNTVMTDLATIAMMRDINYREGALSGLWSDGA